MSSINCYLCASDEGILLDIFAGGEKAHCGKIETCLSVKIEKRNAASTKICHKCAYELDACSKFVQKYRDTREIQRGKSKYSKRHCALCLEPGIKGYIFELGEGTPLKNSLRKIREAIDDSFFKDQTKKLSICLNCRYNLDVLFDLKSVYRTTIDKLKDEKGTESSVYPKTKTRVVSRKTTYIPLPLLNGDKPYESDSSTSSVMPLKRKRGRPRKDSASSVTFRNCEQCDTAVESGIDMYRYHRTGRTVCKDCWLKMDPEKVTNSKRRKLGLVLKDVLVNPSKYTSVYKIERDAKGNTTFLITDDSSENEEKDTPMRRGRRGAQPVVKLTTDETIVVDRKKLTRRRASVKSLNPEDETPVETIVPEIKKPSKRVVSGKWANRDEEPPTKIAVKDRPKTVAERKAVITSDTETMVLRTRRNSMATFEKNARTASLSDIETAIPLAKKVGRPRRIQTLNPASAPKIVASRTQRSLRRAASTVETAPDIPVDKSVKKSVDKSLKKSVDNPVEKSIDKPVEKSIDKSVDKPVEKSVDKLVEKPVDESPDEIDRRVKTIRANSVTSQDSESSGRRTSSARNAKSSESISPVSRTVRSKTKSMSPTTSASETEVETPFACGVCKVEYKNKLIGMAHELTHSKQPEVKLQRVAIPEIIIEEAPTETSLVEEPEQQSHDISSTSDHNPENVESGEKTIAKTHEETETEPDTKLQAEEKTNERDKTSVADNETNVSVDENKDKKTVNDDRVEVNDKCEKDDETNVSDIRELGTNDENKKIEELSANSKTDNDNSENDKNNVDKVTAERPEEDKPSSERKIENEEAENADSEEKSDKGDKVEKDREKHGEEDEEKAEEEDKEAVQEKYIEKVEYNDVEKMTEKGTEKVEHSDIGKVAEKDVEEVEGNDKEESIKDPIEEPVKANGVDADHETDSKIQSDVNLEPEIVPPESSETIENENKNENENENENKNEKENKKKNEKENENKNETESRNGNKNENENEYSAKHEKIVSQEEADNKFLESTLESAPVDVEAAGEDAVVRKESVSTGLVTDVLREVFDLATAEVQKRLETERPDDEKCSTPIAETVENISREIQNSADMPSLEPLVEERFGNEHS